MLLFHDFPLFFFFKRLPVSHCFQVNELSKLKTPRLLDPNFEGVKFLVAVFTTMMKGSPLSLKTKLMDMLPVLLTLPSEHLTPVNEISIEIVF